MTLKKCTSLSLKVVNSMTLKKCTSLLSSLSDSQIIKGGRGSRVGDAVDMLRDSCRRIYRRSTNDDRD